MTLRAFFMLTVTTVLCFCNVSSADEKPIPPPLIPVKAVFSDKSRTYCAIDMNDHVFCFGESGNGVRNVPNDLGPVKSLTMNEEQACAIQMDGKVRCWGDAYTDASNPTRLTLPPELATASAITTGDDYDCGTTLEGKSFCWTYWQNPYELGPEFNDMIQIAAFSNGICGINQNHDVVCHCDVPNSTWYSMQAPPDKALKIAFDEESTGCLMTPDHQAKCFGEYNENNQLTPKNLGPVKDISVGRGNACAITANDTIRCWKTWGPGTFDATGTPIPDKVIGLANGQWSGCGILASDYTLRCWWR